MKKVHILIITLILFALFTQLNYAGQQFLSETERPSPIKKNNAKLSVYDLQKTYHAIYKLYKDSVVFISTEKTVKTRLSHPFFDDPLFREHFGDKRTPNKRKKKGLGTGFIISSDGYICTNHHVVNKMDTVIVKIGHNEYKAKIIASDQITDIALLKIKGRKKFKPVFFGDSNNVKIGDIAVAIGNPFGLDKTITTGIVSATGRSGLDSIGNSHIQTDASINPGNSGGPLINIDGEVIGVNRMIFSRTGGNLGISFAIPVNRARKVLHDLKQYGKVKRGYIGVRIASTFTQQHAKTLGLNNNKGVLVANVETGGPADRAGISANDVITHINNIKVNNFVDLLRIVSHTKIGNVITVTVWSKKRKRTYRVVVTERP